MGRIVVGVDGSEGSRHALQWAVDEAALRGASVEVIHTYEHSPAWTSYALDEGDPGANAELIERVRADVASASAHAAAVAQGLVDQMLVSTDGVQIEGKAIESTNAAETLVEHSKGADMLVVGSRGRGSFKGLMLGSVSQQCAQHAECPVVIIRQR